MTSQLISLCIDANDPLRLARFWAEALRWQMKAGKNPIHLDLTTASIDDQTDTAARLVELGARHVDFGRTPDDEHVVLADPEGNEFCLIEPTNKFLAGFGRLGSITCDGSRAVGHFWSEALGWPLVWDQDEETAIRAPDGTGPFTTWGPPVTPKIGKNRLHLDIAPLEQVDQRAEVDRLTSLGATRIDIGQGDVEWVVMADPGGNEYAGAGGADGAGASARAGVIRGRGAAVRVQNSACSPWFSPSSEYLYRFSS